jgi:hypothetical protein
VGSFNLSEVTILSARKSCGDGGAGVFLAGRINIRVFVANLIELFQCKLVELIAAIFFAV